MKKLKTSIKPYLPLILSLAVLCAVIITLCVLLIPSGGANLTLEVYDLTITQGESGEIKYLCNKDANISIEIYDESIASLQGNVVTGIKAGSTTFKVTATYKDSKATKSARLTVKEDLNSSLVDLPAEIKLYVLDKNIEAANHDGYFNEKAFEKLRPCDYEILSDETNVVKISNNIIKANKVGSAEIVFKATNSSTTQSVAVTVESVAAELILSQNVFNLNVGDSVPFETRLMPIYYTGEPKVELEYDEDLIKIENNILTALSSGNCQIKVFLSGELVATAQVHIASNATMTIMPKANCTFDSGVLKVLRGQEARFEVFLSALTGDLEYQIMSGEVAVSRQQNVFFITTQEGCQIKLLSQNLNFSQIITIEVVDSL